MISKRWIIKNPDPQLQVLLSDGLGVHPCVAQLLINRNVRTVNDGRDFLQGGRGSLHDPFLLKDMDKAVARLTQAREKGEKVMIFGDYDVDGVTSSAILTFAFKKFGLDAINHIPHRLRDGYGLNHTIAKEAKEKGVSLLVSVDCGISATAEVETLRAQGIDVVVVDHHEPLEDRLPNAVAVIDPKRKDCLYPFGSLAAVALAFKLSQALLGPSCYDNLDLVALGTIADVVPLYGENRIFVREGIAAMEKTKNFGLKALIAAARIKGKKITPRHIGFILGPRINAMGRIDSAEKSLRLLLAQDEKEAQEIAQLLEEHNRKRQVTQNAIIEDALRKVEQEVNFKTDRVIILCAEGWHRGVVGIVASRIMDTFYRPAIVLSMEEGVAVGSARSIEGFHLFEALAQCRDLLENFGGHDHAAGLTIKNENLEAFKMQMNKIAHETIKDEDLVPSIMVDCEIPLNSVTLSLAKIVGCLEPFGEGNPEPLFCSRALTVKSPAVVLSRETLKFWVSDSQGSVYSAVGFGMGAYQPLVQQGKMIDIVYRISIDDWNKEPTVQLELKDIKLKEKA